MDIGKLKQVIYTANPEREKREKEYHELFNELTDTGRALVKGYDDYEYWSIHDTLKQFLIPIHLADVLLAMQENIRNWKIMKSWGMPTTLKLLKLWNLKDDDLDNQSYECKKFLIELLTK